MFGVGEMVSLLILGAAVILIFFRGRYAWSLPFALLTSAIVSYLLFGTAFHDPVQSSEPASKYYRAYGGALLILWGLVGYVASLAAGPGLVRFLIFIRNIFLVSAASVWMSPALYQLYVNLPFSAQQRMGGFFGNPNEAAMVSVLAVALTLALPFGSRIFQTAALAMACIAVFMTFSKTGIICLIFVLVWHLVRNTKGYWRAMLFVCALVALAVVQNPNIIIEAVAEHPALELDSTQKSRLLAIERILGGQIDERTTTNRTILWEITVDDALEDFPLGRGLGSGHHIVGGLFELGVWQGAHNTFLMMLRESGVLPLLLLVAAMGATVLASFRYARWSIELTCLFVLLIDMMATHGALATRYHNVMLAVVLGGLASFFRARAQRAALVRASNVWPIGVRRCSSHDLSR